jgi:IS605 OrfB family transposase
VKLTTQVKLLPNDEQAHALRDTMARANAACNFVSAWAWEHDTFGQWSLHRACYREVRERFSLSAQVTVRVIAKVADAYKLDRETQRTFCPTGSIAYDERILRWKLVDGVVSLWTVSGRQTVPFVCGDRQRELLSTQQGETDLAFRDGTFYLFATCNVEEPEPEDVTDFLGVDLGIVNLAVDSDGERHSGATVNGLRHRHRRLRRRLQAKRTKSARRLLNKRKRREARFAADVNHCLSKRIVAKAQGTQRGLALEDLKGIRQRVTARRPQRATLHSWSFAQLGAFLSYKAARVGVPVVFVDPRNTSRTCCSCGFVDKRNRPSQGVFSCRSCGFSGLPDHIAAVNIANVARRGLVNGPHVPSPRG